MLSKIFGAAANKQKSAGTTTKGLTHGWRRIVLPASEAPFSMRSIHTATRIASSSPGCEVTLVYILEIPRSYSLYANMPDEEAHAQIVLANGVEEARRLGLDPATEVLRVRESIEGLTKYVEQQSVDLLILGSRPDEVRGLSHEFAAEIFRRSTCEVILDYIANEQ